MLTHFSTLVVTHSRSFASIMRVITLVSLALALMASSMPLSPGSDGGASTIMGESSGTLSAVGSGLGNAVNPPGSSTTLASGLENGSLGSSTTSGSENGVYKSGSSTTPGLESGSISRRVALPQAHLR